MKTKHISAFIFDSANYIITDEIGNQVILFIDYKRGKYHIKAKEISVKSAEELEKIAKDLIRRKKKVNFAKNH